MPIRRPIYLSFLLPHPPLSRKKFLFLSRTFHAQTQRNINADADVNPDLETLLSDVDIALSQPTAKARRLRKESGRYQTNPEHRELEVVQRLADLDEVEEADEVEGPFPSNERRSPAASFGSRQIGAVILPWELQKSVTRLINESAKHLVHTDAKRLFQHSLTADHAADRDGFTPRSWDVHYTPPGYTEVKSASKMSHIGARIHKHRDGTAFASVVMPAQYAVIRAVLRNVKSRLGSQWADNVERVIEWGSGTGAGLWAAMHTFRTAEPNPLAQQMDDSEISGEDPLTETSTTEPLPETSSSAQGTIQEADIPQEEEGSVENSLPELEEEEEDLDLEQDLPLVHPHRVSDITLSSTQISSYIAIEKRDGLSSIARRLLRDIPLPPSTQVSIHKYLHHSERVSRSSQVGLGTIAMSAFLLNSLGQSGRTKREMLRDMWDSGADVLVIIEDATVAGYRNVVDARDYLLQLGNKETNRLRNSLKETRSEYEGKTLAEMGIDDLHPDLAELVVQSDAHHTPDVKGKVGSHVVAPCPHDKACPLAFHQRLTSSGKRSAAVQISARTVRCTFVQRLQRPDFVRLTKHAKKGEEDVGYSYVVIRRGERTRKGTLPEGKEGRVGAVGRWEEERAMEKERKEAKQEFWRESAENAVLVEDEGQLEMEVGAKQDAKDEDKVPATQIGIVNQEDISSAVTVETVDIVEPLKGEVLEEALREESYDWPRINFPPLKRGGHVVVDACMPEGSIMRMTFTRSQSKQIYYDARKSRWGDIFPHASKNTPMLRYTAPNDKGPRQPAPGVIPLSDLEAKAEREAERKLDEMFGVGHEKVSKRLDKATRALQVKKLLGSRARGGEGALSKEEKVSTRAGWDEVTAEIKKSDKKTADGEETSAVIERGGHE